MNLLQSIRVKKHESRHKYHFNMFKAKFASLPITCFNLSDISDFGRHNSDI